MCVVLHFIGFLLCSFDSAPLANSFDPTHACTCYEFSLVRSRLHHQLARSILVASSLIYSCYYYMCVHVYYVHRSRCMDMYMYIV